MFYALKFRSLKSKKLSKIGFSKSLPYAVPLFLLIAFLAGGCGKKEATVAKVGNKVIDATEFKEAMIRRYRTEEFAAKRDLKERQEVLQGLIDNKLKLLDAYNENLDEDSVVVAKTSEVQKQAAVQELYKVEILDKIIPPEAVREHYEKMQEEIWARHILLKSFQDMSESDLEMLRARTEKIYAELLAGADFDSMAKAVSEDVTTAQRGGDLGYFTWGKMVDEFQEAAFAMEVGEMSAIIKSSYGFHIIKLEDRRQNENAPAFEDEEDNIRMSLRRTYQDTLSKVATAYLEDIKQGAGLTFDYANIQKILDKVSDPSVPRNQDYFSNFNEEERNWVVASVQGDTVTVNTLAEETSKTGPPRWRDQKAIIQMVERMYLPDLLADRARSLGLYNKKNVKQAYETSLEAEMTRRIEVIKVADKIDLSDETLSAFYEEHTEDFMTDSTVEVQEIYILVDEEKSRDKAFAEKIAKKAKRGQNYTNLVKKYNDRKSTTARDGKIGPITSRQYGAMGKSAFALEIGEIEGPIEMGRRGYSIIKLLDKSPARIKPFDEAKAQVERKYKMENTEALRDAWMEELNERHAVKIYDDQLMAVLPMPEETAADTSSTEVKEPKMKTIPLDKLHENSN